MTTKQDMQSPRGTEYEKWKKPMTSAYHCGNCPFMKEWFHRVPEFLYCELSGEELSPSEQLLLKKKGCLSHPSAQAALREEHDDQVREKVLDELIRRIDTATEPDGSVGELFHISGLHCIIDSLRSGVRKS